MSGSEEKIGARLEDLEIMAAHQAQTIEDLSGELRRAYDTIDRLQRAVRSLGERFQALEEISTPKPEVTKPPHY